MKLIDNWKQALKMQSVQIAIIYTIAEWWMAESTVPQTASEWMTRLIGLVFIIFRLLSQPELYVNKKK